MPFLPLYFAQLGMSDAADIALWSGLSLGVTPGMTAPDVRALAEVIRVLPSMNISLLIVEHDMEFVRIVADRIIVMHRGRHYAAGSVAEIEQHAGVREI